MYFADDIGGVTAYAHGWLQWLSGLIMLQNPVKPVRYRLNSGLPLPETARVQSASATKMIFLGVDPGSRVTGLASIEMHNGRFQLLGARNVRLEGAMSDRLCQLQQAIDAWIVLYNPIEAGIEKVFTAVNPASALKLGQARGAAIAAIATRKVPLFEYAATRIKNTIVGYGRAEKHQVQAMVQREFSLEKPLASDASDAVAVALTHAHLRLQTVLLGDNRI